MRGRRGLLIGAGVLVVGLIAGGGYAGHKVHAAHQACESIRSYERATGPVQHIGDGTTRFAVLGDSYSTGDLLDDRGNAWTHAFADERDATLDVVAQGGTGYLNAGFCGDGRFADRAATVPAHDGTVIVEGGLNDVQMDAGDLQLAADVVLDHFDGRRTIVLGPVDAPSVAGEAEVDAVLRDVAESHDATYVSALEWTDLRFGADGKHLSPAGHRTFADHVADALS